MADTKKQFRKGSIIVTFLMVMLLAGCTNTTQDNMTGNVVADQTIDDDSQKIVIYFFWGDGCPHCANEKPFLEELEKNNPEIEVKMFETWNNPENVEIFKQITSAYGTTAQGVPTTFVGDEFWVGYSDSISTEIKDKVDDCLENGCTNPGDRLN